MMLRWWRHRARAQHIGRILYDSIVAQSRAEAFYRAMGVPDTMEGRLEVILLHMYLVLERLRPEGAGGEAVSRALIEAFVADMDASMREIGVSDLGVPRRVKRAAAALYERARAYAAAQQESAAPAALDEALAQHIYGLPGASQAGSSRLAGYARDALAALNRQDGLMLLDGGVDFPTVSPDKTRLFRNL